MCGGLIPRFEGHLLELEDHGLKHWAFPFDSRFTQLQRWAKPMVFVPPLNSYHRITTSDDRRMISSNGKNIFSDTLQGGPNITPQLDSSKLTFSHSQLRMPQSSINFSYLLDASDDELDVPPTVKSSTIECLYRDILENLSVPVKGKYEEIHLTNHLFVAWALAYLIFRGICNRFECNNSRNFECPTERFQVAENKTTSLFCRAIGEVENLGPDW